jgi:uncharacterized protein YjbJ (UPF0337 family)
MNWDRIEGSWKQFKGSARARWGSLIESRLDVVAAKRDLRAGRIQEVEGIAREVEEKREASARASEAEKKRDLRHLQ